MKGAQSPIARTDTIYCVRTRDRETLGRMVSLWVFRANRQSGAARGAHPTVGVIPRSLQRMVARSGYSGRGTPAG
jgi:hypothetical protein